MWMCQRNGKYRYRHGSHANFCNDMAIVISIQTHDMTKNQIWIIFISSWNILDCRLLASREWTGGWVDRQHWLQQSTWVKILSVNIDGVTTRLNCLCYTHIVCYFGTVCVIYISIVSARLEYLQIVSARLEYLQCISRGGWGCEVSLGGHHRQRGKTTIGSALDGAVQ